jgi:hypothetical protein
VHPLTCSSEEPITALEVKEYDDLQGVNIHNTEQGWDGLVEDLADDKGFIDQDEDGVFAQEVCDFH